MRCLESAVVLTTLLRSAAVSGSVAPGAASCNALVGSGPPCRFCCPGRTRGCSEWLVVRFEFELAPVEAILPWDPSGERSLSWFMLTDGRFLIPVGEQVLFEYSEEILRRWGRPFDQPALDPRFLRAANYNVAAFVEMILQLVGAASARLPEKLERLVSRWDLLCQLAELPADVESDKLFKQWAAAWSWLGERRATTGFLAASPTLHMARVGEEVRVHWDSRDRVEDGTGIWTATCGVTALPVEEFLDACRQLSARFLEQMSRRAALIARGEVPVLGVVDPTALWADHDAWTRKFASYFADYRPEVPLEEAERALAVVAASHGFEL